MQLHHFLDLVVVSHVEERDLLLMLAEQVLIDICSCQALLVEGVVALAKHIF